MYILKKIDNNFELFDNDKFISNNLDFSALSEEEQKEIGWFDVEKLAEQFVVSKVKMSSQAAGVLVGFIEGFQEAQELLSDRRFTLDDIKEAIKKSREQYWDEDNRGFSVNTEGDWSFTHTEEQIIQSLSQPKSWSVELEMESVCISQSQGFNMKSMGSEYELQPKLTGGKVKILKLL